MNLRQIVVATDESDAGRQAVRSGLELAGRVPARVTVSRDNEMELRLRIEEWRVAP